MDTWERFSRALEESKKVEEECGCEEGDTKSKKKIVDLRGMRTDINNVKNKLRAMGLKMSQELEGEQLDEFLGTGRVVAGRSQAGSNPAGGSKYTQAGTVQKVFGVEVPGSFQQGVSASDVQRHNQKSSSNTQIKPDKVSTDQLLGKKSGGQITVGITPDKKPAVPTAKPAVPAAKPQTASAAMSQVFKGTPLSGVANIANRYDRRINYRDQSPETRRQLGLQNSYEPEGELVDEGKKDLPQTKMYRKAGNLARQALSSKGAKKEKAMDRSAKIVSAITRETERKRFDEIGKSPAHNEEYQLDEEGMSLKDFKANRRKITGAEERADARKRGHEGKTWADSGRTYSPDEARSRRAKMSDVDRSARHSTAVDPDTEDTDSYSADRTKNPKKLRKQKAMGELGEGYIEEKSLSRAQQRFFGMVRAAQDGKMKSPSPEVAKAAKEMTTKQAHDFAATKHKGLPEKKEVKEEISLVEKMIAQYSPICEIELDLTEAPKNTISGGSSKSPKYKTQAKGVRAAQMGGAAMSGDMGEVQRLGQTKTTVKKSKSDQEPKQDQEQTPTTSQKRKGRGQGDTSGYARGAAITAAARIKLAKMKRRDQEKDKQKSLEQREKQKRIDAEITKADNEEKRKETRKKEMTGAVSGAVKNMSFQSADSRDSATKAADVVGHNIGQVAGAAVSATKGIIGSALKAKNEKKATERKEKRNAEIVKKVSSTQSETFSNWREEFIVEIDDVSVDDDAPQKIIDVSKKKNKIEINPKLDESKEQLQEFLPALAAVASRLGGGLAARGVASRIGAGAVEGGIRSKLADIAGKKAGEVTSDTIKDKLTSNKKEPSTAQSFWSGLIPDKDIAKEEFSNWRTEIIDEETAAWQRKEGKNPEGGLNKKGIASYRRENPGSKLSLAVTTPPSKLDPDSKSAKRRKSFCARMGGMPGPMKDEKGRPTRKALSLRKWNC